MPAPSTLALDLGSTRVKLASFDPEGAPRAGLDHVRVLDAPRPTGEGLVRVVDPEAYRRAAESLLASAAPAPGTRLAIASQRSSFLLWERAGGAPRTPLISWQDRSAAPWCAAHAIHEPRLGELTGLPLSPHYAGPKLAHLLAARPDLAAPLGSGALCFGTLETWLAARWSDGVHATDLSMAARTLMLDVRAEDWSDELLALYGVPRACLPEIVDSGGRDVPLTGGLRLAASVADQAAGLIAALGDDDGAALVNLGTGGFVLRPSGARFEPLGGYLAGPVARVGGLVRHALEGTINGGGATLDGLAPGPTAIPASDPAPEAFCLPDENGIGAPHWRPRVPFSLSDAARSLPAAERRRVAAEGLSFRVREILDDLAAVAPLERVVLTGGLSRDPFVGAGLAALLDVPVARLDQAEGTLLGAARLAAGIPAGPTERPTSIQAGDALAWLVPKYARWRTWLGALLAT